MNSLIYLSQGFPKAGLLAIPYFIDRGNWIVETEVICSWSHNQDVHPGSTAPQLQTQPSGANEAIADPRASLRSASSHWLQLRIQTAS